METAYYILNAHLPAETWPYLLAVFVLALSVDRIRGRAGRNGRCGRVYGENHAGQLLSSHTLCVDGERRNVCGGWADSVVRALFVTYLMAILFATLIFRTPAGSLFEMQSMKAEWVPLWSWYEVIVHGDRELRREILLNIILFMPAGFLLRILYRVKIKDAFLMGLAFSAVIEILQLVTCRGLFEWDDMLHNGLGCAIGCCAAVLAGKVWSRMHRDF
ncbi:MAG: VanZ family protein [Lachnospiraceae bacterium]|nr:VanZ family protein [Lachnospiraceae bacterium]